MKYKKRSKKFFALTLATLFIFNLVDIPIIARAEENNIQLSLKPQYNVDVVLTVEDSKVDPTNFEKDLRAKLNELGVKDSRIKITGLKAQEVSAQDTFAWNTYDHKGNWGEDNYPNGDGKPDPKDNQHIIVKNDGKNITFYGYGQPGYKDFMFMPNDQNSKKTFEFELNENGINYHSMEGGGFLFNSKIENGKLSGYSILFTQSGVNVYKINNIDANAFHDSTSYSMSNYPGITLVKSYGKDISKQHSIKIETTDSKIDMWDNGNQTINSLILDTKYGNGFGPIASYTQHGCNILSYFSFNNLSMKTLSTTKFKDLIRKPEWGMNSKRFVINLNDTSDEDFHNLSAYGEILTRITSENIHYLGWGTNKNKDEAEDLIKKNNENGMFVDNANYNTSIDSIANYICNKLKQSSEGETKIIIGQPIDVEVNPSNLKENTANDDYPLGGWKLDHDDKYYENGMGKATFDGQYMDSLNMIFDKPGKYNVTFRDNVVTPNTVYAHRMPIANFDAEVESSNGVYTVSINDNSYDEDRKTQSDKGIQEEKWQWRESTSSEWIDGQIPESISANKQYLIQLKVKDYDGAWSNPLVKYISTIENNSEKPLANFILTPEIFYSPIMKNITVVDNSYDPQGKEITERQWVVEKDGKVIYTGNTPMTDFSNSSEGKYTISLKVKTSIWSESFSRSFMIKDIKGEIDKATGDVNIGYAPGDNENNVTKDLILSSTGTNNTLVRWSSNDPSVTKYGKVTRPTFFQGDKTVNLTATLYNNGVNSTKNFTVIVKAVPNNAPILKAGEKIGFINNTISFSENDFTSNYSDAEGSTEKSIIITALPGNGKLFYNNNLVNTNDEIQISDIANLSYVPDKDFVGKTEFGYKASDGYDYSLAEKMVINIKDNIPPVAAKVSIISNNSKDVSYAKAGDTITISFTSSKVLAEDPKVTILGKEAKVTKVGGNSYNATYVINGNESQGVASFVLGKLKDQYNNESQEINVTTDGSFVIVDTIAPAVTGVVEGKSYKPGVSLTTNEGKAVLNGKDFNSGDKVTSEGDHTIVVTDPAGNVTKVNFNVDGTAPIISEVKDNTYYNRAVTPKFNEGTATLDGKPFISSTEVSEEGVHQIIAIDRAGNTSMVSFVIDKTAPLIKEVIENGQYNKDVKPTFNEGTATLDGKEYHSGEAITSEGRHTIIVTDNAGNTSTVNFIIDKTAPVITGVKDGESYNKNKTVSFNEGTGILDGKPVTSGTEVTEEGQHIITIIDGAGNVSSATFIIDKTAPIINGVEDKTFYPDKVVITSNEGEALLDGVPFNNGSEVQTEGSHTIVVTDKAGNITTKTFTIDKTAPAVSKIKNGEIYKEDVTPEYNEGTATLDGKPYVPGTKITEEGEHTLVIKDEAGNTTVVTFKIDKSMPKTLNVRGKIYSANGSVDNAKIILVDADGKNIGSTTSDKEGNYSFNNQKTGLYKIIANKNGIEQSMEVNLQPSKPTDKEKVVDLYLSKYKVVVTAEPSSIVGDGVDTTTLTVNVLDENNKPVPGKTVTLKVTIGTLLNGDTVITDKDGNALFTLQSSKVTGDDMSTVTVSAKIDGLDVPVSNDAIIHFAPGSIKGIVVDNETGLPVSGAIVEVSKDFDKNGIPDFYAKVITGADGKYKIAIPKGNIEYDLKITKKITLGKESKLITFNQKTNAGSVTSQGKESYNATNTATGLLLMKSPTGQVNLMDDYSKYSIVIVDGNGNLVNGISGQGQLDNTDNKGVFNFSGLERDKIYYAAIYYNLPDGSKIKVGTSKIKVSNNGELNVANCLIDPYGDVTNIENGKLISGANVKLYYANTARNISRGIKPGTLVELPTVKDFPPADNLNPQSSDANGKYAWMVFPNTDYYIVATAEGYEKYTSDIISVNEEIVRHDIKMTPIKAQSGQNNSTENNGQGTKYDRLVQTGYLFDNKLLLVLGTIFLSVGIVLYRRKTVK